MHNSVTLEKGEVFLMEHPWMNHDIRPMMLLGASNTYKDRLIVVPLSSQPKQLAFQQQMDVSFLHKPSAACYHMYGLPKVSDVLTFQSPHGYSKPRRAVGNMVEEGLYDQIVKEFDLYWEDLASGFPSWCGKSWHRVQFFQDAFLPAEKRLW